MAAGEATPCFFHHKLGGCKHGDKCEFLHAGSPPTDQRRSLGDSTNVQRAPVVKAASAAAAPAPTSPQAAAPPTYAAAASGYVTL